MTFSDALQARKFVDHREIESELAEIFSRELHVDVPSRDCDLFETGILDSLQLVELIFRLEQHFGVRMSLDETDLESFRNIQRIAVALASQNRLVILTKMPELDLPKIQITQDAAHPDGPS